MTFRYRDPFAYKHFPRFHPFRILFTVQARLHEAVSRRRYDRYSLPFLNERAGVPQGDYDTADTAVTPAQMAVLDWCVAHTASSAAPVVEIGAFRGVTTQRIASRTARHVFAVDPFIGYGSADADMVTMKHRTRDLSNVTHLRMTSGDAARTAGIGMVSFIFIDAVHDYVNVLHDGTTWAGALEPGGLIAFHDTDNRAFPGVQRAVWRMASGKTRPRLALFAHTEGLVVLTKPAAS